MRRIYALTGVAVVLAGCGSAPQYSNSNTPSAPVKTVEQYNPFVSVDTSDIQKATAASELVALAKSKGGSQAEFELDRDFYSRMNIPPFEVCFKTYSFGFKFDRETGVAVYSQSLSDAQGDGYRYGSELYRADPAHTYPSFTIEHIESEKGRYMASNALGAEFMVTEMDLDKVYLVLDPAKRGKSVYIESEPIVGEDFKNMMLCVTSVPVAPYYQSTSKKHTPKVSVPIDGMINSHFFRVKVAGASLVSSTGRLYRVKIGYK